MPASQSSQPEQLEAPSPIAARAAILVTIVLTAAVLALLLYFAITAPAPDRVIVVRASTKWEGTDLIVEGGKLGQPQETTIMRAGNYIVPFFVWPGVYTLHVKSQGVEVYEHQFNMTTQPSEQIDLTMSGATTLPSTRPSTMPAELDHSGAGAAPAGN